MAAIPRVGADLASLADRATTRVAFFRRADADFRGAGADFRGAGTDFRDEAAERRDDEAVSRALWTSANRTSSPTPW